MHQGNEITHSEVQFKFIDFYKCSASLDKVILLRKVRLQVPLHIIRQLL